MKNIFGRAPEVLTTYELNYEIDSIQNGLDDCVKQHLPISKESLDRLTLLQQEKRRRYAEYAAADKARDEREMAIARAKVEAASKRQQEQNDKEYFMCTLSSLLGGGER